MDTAEQLASVRALILKIQAHGVQGYSEAGQTYTYQNLPALYARERELIARQNAESGTQYSLAVNIDY